MEKKVKVSKKKVKVNASMEKKVKVNVKKKKIALDVPFDNEIPKYSPQITSKIEKLLRNILRGDSTPLKLESKKENHPMSKHLYIGFNSVVRELEKKHVKCVFYVRFNDRSDILSHILKICDVQGVPAIPINKLAAIVSQVVKVKRVIVIGLRNSICEGMEDEVTELYKECLLASGHGKTSVIKVPETPKVTLNVSKTENVTNVKSLLLKRVDTQRRAFITKEEPDCGFMNIFGDVLNVFREVSQPKIKDIPKDTPSKKPKKERDLSLSFFIDNAPEAIENDTFFSLDKGPGQVQKSPKPEAKNPKKGFKRKQEVRYFSAKVKCSENSKK